MSDILSVFNIGGASVTGAIAQGAVVAYLRQRTEEARDILVEEFRYARINAIAVDNEDELGGVLFRYLNAVREN